MKEPEILLRKFIKNENLIKHCYSVESAMKFYAKQLNEDQERWGAAGLLHDLDWEMYPDTHPVTAVPILTDAGYDREFIDAILGHAYPERTDVPRESRLAKYLFACDEITGFIMAYSLMKEKGLNETEPKSIRKKMKDKAFARNVNRDDIVKGAEEIGLDLDTHIGNIIESMKNDERINIRK
ncbi:MAG TPA: HDIG domain-containing protein [Ignavibacteria bacterium]|nr:HDIG domain-containing protein [Ignavibacteria bacterium]HRJ99620.1 HDIG domain-containing protein [Ignavibacteria bacterium]